MRAYPENDAVLRDMINKRDELAHLVGRPNYATLNFEDRMLNTPEKVQSLLDDMAAAAKPAAERDYAKKLALLQQLQPGATKIEPWDSGYVADLVQKQSYGYDRQEARKYFAYDKVRDGILQLTEDLFGVDIRPWATPEVGQAGRNLRGLRPRQADRPLLFRLPTHGTANMSMPMRSACAPASTARSRSARWS